MNSKVIIIGGGLGGLSAAIYLRKYGFQVELHEKNSTLGGKMNEYIRNGYRFDTGPSLLTMPFVIDHVFETAGYDTKLLELESIDPVCRYFFPDGSVLDTSSNLNTMNTNLNVFTNSEKNSYKGFLEYSKTIYDLTADTFLFTPIHEIKKLLTLKNIKLITQILKIDPLRTVHQGVKRYFSDPRLLQLFDRYATYNGSNPYRAPATLNIIPYVEYGLGAYYIKGGMYRLIDHFSTMARELGVKIFTQSAVEKIDYDQNGVNGVVVNNQSVKSDFVLCNADIVTVFSDLLMGKPRKTKKLKKLEPSLSGLVFLWGVKKYNYKLEQHNIFFSTDYKKEFDHIFNDLKTPDDPTVYVAITSKTDPSHAPSGCENWFVLINMPYLNEKTTTSINTTEIKNKIFKKLENFDIDIKNDIETERIITPYDFYEQFKSNRGSIYGISSNNRKSAFTRPANKYHAIKGLYFAGGSVHPGGGVPLTVLSGKMTADLILKDRDRAGMTINNQKTE